MGFGRRFFSLAKLRGEPLFRLLRRPRSELSLEELAAALEIIHIKLGLLDPYGPLYPLVEPRELIPSFDAPLIEYPNLPAFSLVALDRGLNYQDEGFQFDLLEPEGTPPDPRMVAQNRLLIRDRLPRDLLGELDKQVGRRAFTALGRYLWLFPFLVKLDRGHVISRETSGAFHLAGIYASLPSDLDGEIKRLGRQIGKFRSGDNEGYAKNRQFVYRFLMEQAGLPICGERHTSAALFARRLMRRRERFLVKVLGASDRAVTTFYSPGAKSGLPRVEKVALVAASDCSEESQEWLRREGFFIDPRRQVVILRVRYAQHAYHPDNVLEERALSVSGQEVIHPRTGEPHAMDILGLGQDRLLLLNDIVRGEHEGGIVYRGREPVAGTADHKSRLKFLSAWLGKHRSLLADYAPDNFERVNRVLVSYLDDPANQAELERQAELHAEVRRVVADLRVAHRLRLLEKMVANRADASGRQLQHVHVLIILAHVLSTEGDELLARHPRGLGKLLRLCRRQMAHPYLKRRYLGRLPQSRHERELVTEYGILAQLVERYEGKARVDSRP